MDSFGCSRWVLPAFGSAEDILGRVNMLGRKAVSLVLAGNTTLSKLSLSNRIAPMLLCNTQKKGKAELGTFSWQGSGGARRKASRYRC